MKQFWFGVLPMLPKMNNLCVAKHLSHDNLLPPSSLSDPPRASNSFRALFFSTLKQIETRLATHYYVKNLRVSLPSGPKWSCPKVDIFQREGACKILFGKKWLNALFNWIGNFWINIQCNYLLYWLCNCSLPYPICLPNQTLHLAMYCNANTQWIPS